MSYVFGGCARCARSQLRIFTTLKKYLVPLKVFRHTSFFCRGMNKEQTSKHGIKMVFNKAMEIKYLKVLKST